jgi:hypothetical protein
MTDTDVTSLSCYNIVGHTRMHVMGRFLSTPAALQALGRVEYATTYAVAPPDSRIALTLILTLFSQRLLVACKKLTLSVSTCLPTIARILHTWHDLCQTLNSRLPPRFLRLRVCQTLNPW